MLRSRSIVTFVAIVCVGALVWPRVARALGIGAGTWWLMVGVVGLLAAAAARPRAASGHERSSAGGFLRSSEFLCDRCRYDNDRDCSRPERPNATECDDYRPR